MNLIEKLFIKTSNPYCKNKQIFVNVSIKKNVFYYIWLSIIFIKVLLPNRMIEFIERCNSITHSNHYFKQKYFKHG